MTKLFQQQLEKFDEKFPNLKEKIHTGGLVNDDYELQDVSIKIKQFLTNFYHEIRKAEREKLIEEIYKGIEGICGVGKDKK